MTTANNSSAVPDGQLATIAAVQNYLVDVVRSFGDVNCAAYISTWHKPEEIAKNLGIAAPPAPISAKDHWEQMMERVPQSVAVAANIENHARFQGLLEWVLCAYKDGEKEDLPRVHAGIDELIANINAWGAALSAPSIAPVGELRIVVDAARNYCDCGPDGEGWKSDELSRAVASIDAYLEKEAKA